MNETRTTATPARPARRSALRRTLTASALAVAATAGVGAVGTGVAAAAGPNYLPHYGSSTTFPTWVWGSTTLCARNETTTRTASVKVQAGTSSEYFYVRPGDTGCIHRWWGGTTIRVTNAAYYTPVTVWTN